LLLHPVNRALFLKKLKVLRLGPGLLFPALAQDDILLIFVPFGASGSRALK
jgi:hypothetical protein